MEKDSMENIHLFTLGCDIARGLNDPFSSIMVFVQLIAKAFKHVMKSAAGLVCLCLSSRSSVAVSLNTAGHCAR
jgi:hypothetical protein